MEPRRALPEKKYFKIGEVSDLVGVEPHVLRYWETQFPQLRPHKARSGHRLYRRREVEALLVIRELLHVRRFTIAGARQALRQPGALNSLIPRFFQAPEGLDQGAETLRPGDGEMSEEGDVPASAEQDEALVELEAEGLDEDALAAALDRESAERAARDGVALVEVEAQALTERAPDPPPLLPAHGARKPAQLPIPLPSPAAARMPMGQRALLEGALAEAHHVLALLDRMDRDASRHRVHA